MAEARQVILYPGEGCMNRRLFLPLLLAAAALAQTQAPAPLPADRERWNKTFANPNPAFNTKPNALLVEAVKGRKPGKALDIGLGQGRNSIFLAQQGWDVTGVDISDEGIRIAKETAAKLGLQLNTVQQSVYEFDFGREQWDLVSGIFMHQLFSHNAERIRHGLKPGGIVVAEGFHEDRFKVAGGRPFGLRTNELLRVFDGLRIVYYEDRVGPADWAGGKDMPIVRFIARKE